MILAFYYAGVFPLGFLMGSIALCIQYFTDKWRLLVRFRQTIDSFVYFMHIADFL